MNWVMSMSEQICTDFTLVSPHIVTVSTDDHSLVNHLVWGNDPVDKRVILDDKKNYWVLTLGASTYRALLPIYVKDYADVKIGCVPVACHLPCHYRPRELSGEVASFGLRNRDIQDFLACVMSDADAFTILWSNCIKIYRQWVTLLGQGHADFPAWVRTGIAGFMDITEERQKEIYKEINKERKKETKTLDEI